MPPLRNASLEHQMLDTGLIQSGAENIESAPERASQHYLLASFQRLRTSSRAESISTRLVRAAGRSWRVGAALSVLENLL